MKSSFIDILFHSKRLKADHSWSIQNRTWATATNHLATSFDSTALKVISVFLTIQVALYWMWCFGNIIYAGIQGRLFAPELTCLEGGSPKMRWKRKGWSQERLEG